MSDSDNESEYFGEDIFGAYNEFDDSDEYDSYSGGDDEPDISDVEEAELEMIGRSTGNQYCIVKGGSTIQKPRDTSDYKTVVKILRSDERYSNKDHLTAYETARIVSTSAQMISQFNFVPPIDTTGLSSAHDIAMRSMVERGKPNKTGGRTNTVFLYATRDLPPTFDHAKKKIIIRREIIDPNDPMIAIPDVQMDN